MRQRYYLAALVNYAKSVPKVRREALNKSRRVNGTTFVNELKKCCRQYLITIMASNDTFDNNLAEYTNILLEHLPTGPIAKRQRRINGQSEQATSHED